MCFSQKKVYFLGMCVALVSTVFYSDLLDLTAKIGVANC